MTQHYYSERILPVYLEAIAHARSTHGHDFFLVEDGDPSHGMRKPGLAQRKRKAWSVDNLVHPPSSPDLNPSEAAWNIFKQRLRQVKGLRNMDDDEVQNTIDKVWDTVTLKEVRERILDMPERCNILVNNGGKRIKGRKW